MPETHLLASLRTLHENKVDFILFGGLAAVLQGAPIQTYDVDIVYSKDEANVDRLLPAILAMDAIFRFQPDRRLRPNRSHLMPHSTWLNISEELMIRVLDLGIIITLKEQLAGNKDLAVLPVLRQTLSERKKKHP